MRRSGGPHTRKKKDGGIVRYNHRSLGGERLEEPLPCTDFWLEVGEVADGAARKRPGVLLHPIHTKTMVPKARPAVAKSEGFKDEERSPQRPGPVQRPVQGGIP